jgi:cysteinyl-tRNA synthetase
MLCLFNTIKRKKEEFKPINDKKVGLYTCGPTVYNFAHLGNLRTYVFEDILKRVLIYNGYKVKHVMNITDVGHLTSDQDEGEDKMDLAIKREKKDPQEIARLYTEAFKNNLKELNIIEPDIWCQATEHIQEQIELIKQLQKRGYTYETSQAVYFDISKFPRYGQLSGQKIEEKKQGAREDVVIDKEKKNPQDFVLWFKLTGRFKNHIQHWPSPWQEGFPGWHIECSAMSMKYLGETFDIHCGGIDHIGVHHTNEIAQSEAATGKSPWVKYWLHGEFLLLDKDKMAKSADGFITLSTLKEKGVNSLAYRLLCLQTHYRSKMNFSWDSLTAAQNALNSLCEKISELGGTEGNLKEFEKRFEKAINDDLDMPKAVSILWDVIKSDKPDGAKKNTLLKFDKVLGLGLDKVKPLKIPEEIKMLADSREKARISKDYKKADEIRIELEKLGYQIEDTARGPKIKKKR